jgi:hypothetical protein
MTKEKRDKKKIESPLSILSRLRCFEWLFSFRVNAVHRKERKEKKRKEKSAKNKRKKATNAYKGKKVRVPA